MNGFSFRDKVFEYVTDKYSSPIEYPWAAFPDYAVFRHRDNKKWFGLVANVSKDKLGIKSDEKTDILNVKLTDSVLYDFLVKQQGFYPGYHMKKGNWISVLLDGSVSLDNIFGLIDVSFEATAGKKTGKRKTI